MLGANVNCCECDDLLHYNLRLCVSCFPLMSDRKDGHRVFINMISRDVTAITKVDKPLPELFGKLIDRPTEAGMRSKKFDAFADRFASTTRGVGALWVQKFPNSL